MHNDEKKVDVSTARSPTMIRLGATDLIISSRPLLQFLVEAGDRVHRHTLLSGSSCLLACRLLFITVAYTAPVML